MTDSADLLRPGIELLQARDVDVAVLPERTPRSEVVQAAAQADVVLIGLVPFHAAEIAVLDCPGLLVRCGIGFDIIDVEAATHAGIWVANVPDYCLEEVADHTLMLLLAAWRRLGILAAAWRDGRWVRDDLPPVGRIAGRRLGIVGLGRIGSRVARRAAPFGWRIQYHDPFVGAPTDMDFLPLGLEELFATSDAVTLHCPVTAETAHLVDDRLLAAAKPGLVLINTSRGGLVDLGALERALESGRVAAAALDVLEEEPRPDLGHPVLARPEVLVTSHVAWYSLEAKQDLAVLAAEEALRYLAGERPRNLVNPEARPAGYAGTELNGR